MTQKHCIVYICDVCGEHQDDLDGEPLGWANLQIDCEPDRDVCPKCVVKLKEALF